MTPKIHRGALIIYDSQTSSPTFINFQHNPSQINRSLQPQSTGQGNYNDRYISEIPIETIQAEIILDALEQIQPQSQLGIYPQLCALELLLYPSVNAVKKKTTLLANGTWEVLPPSPPLVVFVWGIQRVLPVKITAFSITEEIHDNQLNPIRARVNLSMQVLSSTDFSPTHPGYHIFSAYHSAKETLAQMSHFI